MADHPSPDEHPPARILEDFARGVVDERVAVTVALHVDDCASCRGRVERADPLNASLHAMLSGLPEPIVPDLTETVLAEAARPSLGTEVVLGALCLAAATGLVLLFGDPFDGALNFGMTLHALTDLGGHVGREVLSSTFALTAGLLACLFLAATMVSRLGSTPRMDAR